MTELATVLIVEDEVDLALLLNDYLVASQYKTVVIHDGIEADAWLKSHSVDLILLDLMLPGKSGTDICKDLRRNSDTPIIMITAKVEEIDRLLGLELGADDYICKPFSPREVVARVKTVLKRTLKDEQKEASAGQPIILHPHRNCVECGGQFVELTVVEMSLLQLLFDSPGRIFSRQSILETIYSDYRVVSDRTIDSHVKKLRKKLQQLDDKFEYIQSVYGAGYKYEPHLLTS